MKKNHGVTVFTMPHCPACINLKKWLMKENITFTEKDIIKDLKAQKEFEDQGLKYTPTIFIENGEETHKFIGSPIKELEKILLLESSSQ
ncbi:glutaredoxin [Bacillus cereus]|uniref:glutaredoxin family protein n=1 Tax=Bacillus cereus TaxID=1396 RepID=UPI0020CE2C1D|nr:glutaredoxin [Bacillus cereus]